MINRKTSMNKKFHHLLSFITKTKFFQSVKSLKLELIKLKFFIVVFIYFIVLSNLIVINLIRFNKIDCLSFKAKIHPDKQVPLNNLKILFYRLNWLELYRYVKVAELVLTMQKFINKK